MIRPSTYDHVVSMWPVYLFAYSMAVIFYIQIGFAWRQYLSDQSLGPFSMVLICTLQVREMCCLYCP